MHNCIILLRKSSGKHLSKEKKKMPAIFFKGVLIFEKEKKRKHNGEFENDRKGFDLKEIRHWAHQTASR